MTTPGFKTKRCVLCRCKAIGWCGHVTSQRGTALAGFCKPHKEELLRRLFLSRDGFLGHTSGKVMEIDPTGLDAAYI